MTTAEIVRNLLEKSGKSQKQFAVEAGMHPVTFCKCLNDDSFSMKSLRKIADYQGVSLSSLMPTKRAKKMQPAPLVNGYLEYDGKIEAVKNVEDLERILLAIKGSVTTSEEPEKKKTKIEKKVKDNTPQINLKDLSPKSVELKSKLDVLIEQEHQNTNALKEHPLYYPVPTKKQLLDSTRLKYDSERYVCVAFRGKEDYWKDLWLPLSNMNGGFDYEINGVKVRTSEHAYILGVFSNDSERHLAIQQQVMNEPSGYQAKRNIRMRNRFLARLDWRTFKIDWMLYCVWQKIQQNQEFRSLLLAIPQGATIIEDNSFKNKPDLYWGANNPDRKPFGRLASKFAKSLGLPTKVATKKVEDKLVWDFCNYGVFEGTNEMGRILTYLKDCLHKGVEPEIDYDLLNRKKIHLLGKELHF